MTAPRAGTAAYRWWSQGATDEANARNEELSAEVIDLREALESLARLDPAAGPAKILTALWQIYVAGMPARKRLSLAWKALR